MSRDERDVTWIWGQIIFGNVLLDCEFQSILVPNLSTSRPMSGVLSRNYMLVYQKM
jgi:hypothetical protein